MSRQVILRELWVVIILSSWLIGCTIKIIWKKRLFTHIKYNDETNKKVNFVLIPFVYFCLLFSLYKYLDVVRDIPAIINNEYCKDYAIVMSNSLEEKGFVICRYVSLEINGETERYRLYSHEVYKGQEIKVVYLPYSNVAQMVGE